MREFFRKNLLTSLIIVATVVLAGVAIFTAVRLYQLRTQPVAPTAPTSRPAAQTIAEKTCTSLVFTVSAAEVSPSPSPASCNNGCTIDTDCESGLTCEDGKCRNPSCTDETDCTCAIAGGTSAPTAAPTSAPAGGGGATTAPLPESGASLPTIIGAGVGILLIIGAVLLAL